MFWRLAAVREHLVALKGNGKTIKKRWGGVEEHFIQSKIAK